MSKLLSYISLTLITYLFIFSPPLQLLPFSVSNILAVWAYVYIISNKKRTIKILYFKLELLILLVILFYVLTIYILTGLNGFEPIVSAFKLLFIDFPIAIALILLIEKKSEYNFLNFYKKIFIYTFLTAGIISFFLLFNPSINEYLKNHILRTLDLGTFRKAFETRGFGFSDSMLYCYPIALALGACYILENLKNKIISIIFSLILIIPIFLNARIGVVPIFAYSIFVIIIKREFTTITLAIIFIFLLFQYLYLSGFLEKYSFFILWVSKGYYDTISIFQNKAPSGDYSDLSKMIYFPENIIFGSGKYIFTGKKITSDIGYILQIYYGGIIYLILIGTFFFALIKRISKILTWKHWFPIIALITIIISNFKGNFFASNPGIHTILLLYVFFILYDEQNLEPN